MRTVQNIAAALLIILPLAYNLLFFLLGRRFDYPNILRSPTGEILSRFKAGGVGHKLLWYGFMLLRSQSKTSVWLNILTKFSSVKLAVLVLPSEGWRESWQRRGGLSRR